MTVTGELRSGARANLLMGVGSNRVDVHRACARAERSLEKRAEPLSALFLPAAEYPHALADIAWRKLVLNSAHDSSCACSSDEVVDQVLVRYYEARQIGDGLTHDAMRALARAGRRARRRDRRRQPDRPRPFRTRRRARSRARARVTSSVPTARAHAGAAARRRRRRRVPDDGHRPEGALGARPHARHRVRRPPDPRATTSTPVASTTISTTSCCTRRARSDERIDLDRAEGADARARRRGSHDAARGSQVAPVRHVLFDTGAIDGFGWSCFTAAEGDAPAGRPSPRPRTASCRNEHLRVTVDARDGTYTIETGRRPAASRAAAGSSTAATAATPTTTRRPPTTSSSTGPIACASTRPRPGRCGPGS